MPAVSRLEEKYANELVVIGVHAGKFIAERETENIRVAMRRLGIEHPVVNDRHFRTWRAFGVQAWPTVVLISPDGQIIGQHSGEFTFDQFDEIIEAVAGAYSREGMITANPLHFLPDPAPETTSSLLFPGKVLADPASDRLFIADTRHNRVLIASMDSSGTDATVTGEIGSGQEGFKDGSFSQAALNRPEGMSLSGDLLYIADTENHAIRAADLAVGTLRTVAGTGEQGYTRQGGKGTAAELSSPWDVLARDGFLYIAMAGTHQLWRMDLNTTEVIPFVGSGRENIDDGPNPRATLAQPSGLATDGKRLFFADSESSAIRAADFAADGYTQTLLGEGLFEFGDRDAKGLQARLQHALGVSYYNGKLYIADTYNNKIKLYDISTKDCRTVLGSGDAGELYEPGGLDVWTKEDISALYIADTNNHRIMRSELDADGKPGPMKTVGLRFGS